MQLDSFADGSSRITLTTRLQDTIVDPTKVSTATLNFVTEIKAFLESCGNHSGIDYKEGSVEYELKCSETFRGRNQQGAFESVFNHPTWLINLCESPTEAQFFFFSLGRVSNLRPQVEVGPYRVDFAFSERKIAIEIDGHDYHKTREQRTNDAQRERYLQLSGWRVIRFTGSEIYKDVDPCVEEVAKLLDVFETQTSELLIFD